MLIATFVTLPFAEIPNTGGSRGILNLFFASEDQPVNTHVQPFGRNYNIHVTINKLFYNSRRYLITKCSQRIASVAGLLMLLHWSQPHYRHHGAVVAALYAPR